MARTCIMSTAKVGHTFSRLASEVIERNRGVDDLRILGIESNGVFVARKLAAEISAIAGKTLSASGLDVSAFRDDREGIAEDGVYSERGTEVSGLHVLLVDDVLQSGRTARAALDAIVQLGRPQSIQFLALIDRGHREYPIQPDYVGRLIQTKHRERVAVEVSEGFQVWLED